MSQLTWIHCKYRNILFNNFIIINAFFLAVWWTFVYSSIYVLYSIFFIWKLFINNYFIYILLNHFIIIIILCILFNF